ncbi:MAG TPA: hypothetical protein VNF71_01660 [Acidimicrobiales bacterium]|nr:hypothetical protein [Acidimicrobiales bacterium]
MLTVAAFAMSIGLVVAACSSGNKVAASASGGGTQTGASKPIVVIMSNPRYGQILTTAAGFALYTYTADEPGGAGCDAACLKIWPPLLLPAGDTAPVPGPGVTGLGTLQRGNQLQVTWNGLPLYLFVTDKQPGQVTGQNVVDRAGKWILATVAASTEAPGTTAPASPAGSPSSTRPPATSPPTTKAPAAETPATQPPATQPPATSPPATSPPTTSPTTVPGLPSY